MSRGWIARLDRRRAGRRLLRASSDELPDIDLEEVARGRLRVARRLDLSAGRRCSPSSRPAPSSAWSLPARRSSCSAARSPARATTRSSLIDRDRLAVARSSATRQLHARRASSAGTSCSSTGRRCGSPRSASQQVEDYFARHGGKTILIGRFIGLVRALAPFIAGSSGMPYRAFVPYSVLGTGLWATTFILIGYFASQSIDTVAEIVGRGLIWVRALRRVIVGRRSSSRSGTCASPRTAARWRPRWRSGPCCAPLLALGRRLQPQARFLWERLTPGGLGLEFTTLMAVLAVGAVRARSPTGRSSRGDPGPTPGDTDGARHRRPTSGSGWLDDLAEGGHRARLAAAWSCRWRCSRRSLARRSARRWAELGGAASSAMALIIVGGRR